MRSGRLFKESRDTPKRQPDKRSFVASRCAVSFLLPSHHVGVLTVDHASFAHSLSRRELAEEMRKANTTGAVVTHLGEVIGFAIYRTSREGVEVVRLAVYPTDRHMGVGVALIDWVKRRARIQGNTRVAFPVRETLLGAQKFLASRGVGFRAIGVKREAFADTGEDAFVFEWRSREQS